MKENMPMTSIIAQERISFFTDALTGKVDNPELASYMLLDNVINQEAFIIAINNVFIIIALMFLAGMVLIPFTSVTKNLDMVNNAH